MSINGIGARKRSNALVAMQVAVAGLVVVGSVAATRGGNRVVYGPMVEIGNGTARVYVDVENGAPVEVGVMVTEDALEGLPDHHSSGGVTMPDGHRMFEQILAMPEENPTPYRYVALGWNPGGHEPPGIYDRPHFDFHFYTAALEQRSAMDPARAEYTAESVRQPAAEYVPAGYINPPGTIVPFMGNHWVDPRSPELNGAEFTSTFLYGSWDGEIIFAEPMITRAFLLTRPDVKQAVPVAARHAEPGWYPGSYRVQWIDSLRMYRISLGDFEWRN